MNKCPVHTLKTDNDEIIVNHDLCIYCRECESSCSGKALIILK